MMLALHFIVILSIAWLVFKRYGKEHPRIFWLSLVVKTSMGSALGLIYLYYYSANDTWNFFRDANVLAQFAKNDFVAYVKFLLTDEAPEYSLSQLANTQERSLFLIKIMSVFSWMGGNSYWVSAAWFSFISFLASWYLFLLVTKQFKDSWFAAALSFLFFPSIAFWGSGLVKETMALAGIYFISGLFLKFIFDQKTRWYEWLLALFSFWVTWNLKYYWAALFGVVLFTYLLVYLGSKRIPVIHRHKIKAWMVVFISLCFGASLLHPNFYMSRFLEVLINNHQAFIRISDDDGLIHFYHLHASWSSIIINSPWALISGLLRPFIWEASGLMAILASLENLVISILLVSSLSRITKIDTHRLLLFSTGMYIILLCIFLALSTPNMGTLSRYRVGFLPFLIFIISYRNPLLTYLTNRVKFLQS